MTAGLRVHLRRAVASTVAVAVLAGSSARADDPSTAPTPKLAPPATATPTMPLPAPQSLPPEPLPQGGGPLIYPVAPQFYNNGYGMLPPRMPYHGPSFSPNEYPYGGGYGTVVGVRMANLPPRNQYGPSVSPLEYPYTGFVAGYPYPGYTANSPYPRTVSSYSFGPSPYPMYGPAYPIYGPLGRTW